jgi:hypothetical protein
MAVRRNKHAKLVALLALAGVGVFLLWPWPSTGSRLTQNNLNRLRDGMTRLEVEAILGPPADHTTGPLADPMLITIQQGHIEYPIANNMLMCAWADDAEAVWISFDASNTVRGVVRCPAGVKLKQSPLENLLWRIRRQLHK